MDRIIQGFLKDFLKSQQINEKDESKQFEMFASYCTIYQHYQDSFNLSDVLCGSGGDCGIDALAIIANGKMITSKEEVEDLIEYNGSLTDIYIIFVQAKTSTKFSNSEIGVFGTGVADFLSERPQFVQNEVIKEKCKILNYILRNASKMKKLPVGLLYYVSLGKWNEDRNCKANISKIKKKIEDLNLFSNISFIPVDVVQLQKYYRETLNVLETEIDFSNNVVLPDIPNIVQAYLGYIDYSEYKKLITTDSGEINKAVFYDNVRDYQGDNPVNKAIAESIENSSNNFILLNNGVTIICRDLTIVRTKLTLKDYQIVNGCQTSHELYKHGKEKDNLQIPIKIIQTTNEDTISKIIIATNTQTEVTNEQLMSLKEFHRRLEDFYATFGKSNRRLYYERRSKQYDSESIEKVRIVSISTQIKSVAAMFFDKPHLASRFYGKLLEGTKEIFDSSHLFMPYYCSAYALYRLEYMFRNKLLPNEYRKFRYHLLMLLKYDISNGKIPEMNEKKMEVFCNKIISCVDNNEKLIDEVKKLMKKIELVYKDLSDSELTKSASLVTKLKENL